MTKIAVIDYGIGNILSVQRAFEFCGANVIVTNKKEEILKASKIVLPGVGAFSNAMQSLNKLDLVEVIKEIYLRDIPLLGICLGMQLLFDFSEEFNFAEGLGLIPGKVVKIPTNSSSGPQIKIPQIGWNSLRQTNKEINLQQTILRDCGENAEVYFVHSFMAIPVNPKIEIAHCLYGDQKIVAMIKDKKLFGCQFHPEKSGQIGLKIIQNFLTQ